MDSVLSEKRRAGSSARLFFRMATASDYDAKRQPLVAQINHFLRDCGEEENLIDL
jgi:hypothetical protein